jgi:putative transposase
MLKQRVSRKMRRKKRGYGISQVRLPFLEAGEVLPQFWQSRFYDFNVYTERKRREKLDYMHGNTVTRKLVRRPQDWPWSSYLFYEKGEAGLNTIDPV